MKRKKPRPKREERRRREIAERRVIFLANLSLSNYKEASERKDREQAAIAALYGELARRIAKAHKIEIPPDLERHTCPNCKRVIYPGMTAIIKDSKIRCWFCGYERDYKDH